MESSPKRMTLPPPEWTAKAPEREHVSFGPPPLARRKGGRAEEATLRAQVEAARALADEPSFAVAAVQLARWLASRDRDLDEAVRLAESAIEAGAIDVELLRELAAWLESLGEPARAAAALRAIADHEGGASFRAFQQEDAAYLLVRIGVLLARANEPAEAASAFEQAMQLDPSDALAGEMLGALSAWAPGAVAPSKGAAAYVEAAARRATAGVEDAELEDLLRAFAIDPSHERTAAALADALGRRERFAAADEVWRAHGNARRAPEVHAGRREQAILAGDLTRALGAALDEGLDAHFDGDAADRLNGLLLRMGLTELLAARLEARARVAPPGDRARAYVELARLYAGPLADPTRAAGAHVAAIASDPTCEDAIVALRASLADAERAIEAPGDPRESATRRLAASLRAVGDEAERHRLLIDKLTRATGYDPRWASAAARASARARSAGGASEASRAALERSPSRALSSSAWVDARLAGDVHAQARAIEALAGGVAISSRAILLCVASDKYAASGDRESARRAAEHAVQAEPSSARAIATLADAVAGDTDRAAAAALERAISVVGARSAWCAALSTALEALGEHGYAVAWAQRHVALRPGDRGAIEQLLTRILVARDPSRLADALAWVLSQPQPLAHIAELFARSLGRLGELDIERAAVLARRALEVYGPTHDALRAALVDVAKRAGDDAFAAAVLERCLSTVWARGEWGEVDDARRAMFVELAERRHAMGDRDGEARVLARAVRELGQFPDLLQRAAVLLGEGVSADGELALMEARAEMLTTAGDRGAAAP